MRPIGYKAILCDDNRNHFRTAITYAAALWDRGGYFICFRALIGGIPCPPPAAALLGGGKRKMRILIDADGCPVVGMTVRLGREYGVPVYILCDTSHRFEREGAVTLVFSKGADSVDFALANRVRLGDLVITQDYGLAAMCLARRARVLDQNGREYTAENIDSLLLARHTAQKIRRAGGRLKGPAKRTPRQDADFEKALRALLAGGAAAPHPLCEK